MATPLPWVVRYVRKHIDHEGTAEVELAGKPIQCGDRFRER